MRMQYAQMDMQSQKAYVQTQAVNFIQNQAPCSNMNKKGFWMIKPSFRNLYHYYFVILSIITVVLWYIYIIMTEVETTSVQLYDIF